MKVNLRKAMMLLFCVTSHFIGIEAYNWSGHTLDDILSEVSDDGTTITASNKTDVSKTVFLYNAAKGKFMNLGGSWGTHATLEDVGIRCWVMQHKEDESKGEYSGYLVQTACSNVKGNKGDKLGIEGGPFLDLKNVSRGGKGHTYWQIEKAGNGNAYYLSMKDPNSTTNQVKYLVVDEDGKNVIAGDKPSEESLAQWIFVTEKDLRDLFSKTAVELGGVPADATFLLSDYGFDRFSTEISQWSWSGTSGDVRVGIDSHYQGWNPSSKTWNWPDWGNPNKDHDAVGSDGANGRYWCVKIHERKGVFSQTVKINKTGWYRILCQGEYYEPNASSNKYAVLFAKAGDEQIEQPLRLTSQKISKFTTDKKTFNNTEGKRYYDNYGDYTNTVMVYVDCGEANEKEVNMQLGIEVKDGVPATYGVAVDAFRLQNVGTPSDHDLVLDENKSNFDYINDDTDKKEYTHSVLYLKRKFKLNCWNTIVLPVSLTSEQFNTAFGADSKLARYEGVSGNRLQFTVQDDKKTYDTEEKGAFLKANKPYIIWPTVDASANRPSYSYTYYPNGEANAESKSVEITAPYYVVNDVSMTKDKVKDIVVEDTQKDGGYSFKGILVQDYQTIDGKNSFMDGAHLLKGDYTFNQGKLHQFKADYGMKGFRAWFHPVDGNSSASKLLNVEINGVQGEEVTGIDAVEAGDMDTENVASRAIYNLSGQKINVSSIDELPSGIYVVNHKKYVIK